MASIQQVSRDECETSGEVRPEDGFAASPAFDTASATCQQMRAAYETIMPELYFGTEPLPSWDAICTRVIERRANL